MPLSEVAAGPGGRLVGGRIGQDCPGSDALARRRRHPRVSCEGLSITLRLACVDAPEMGQSPYGQHARHDLQTRLAK